MTETNLNVPDMSCAHCKTTVEGSLNAIEGVERSNADFEKGVVGVSYDETRVKPEDLELAIQSAGYKVASWQEAGSSPSR